MSKGKELVGSIYPSNNYGNMEIIEYHGYHKIKVRFVNTGYETVTYLDRIKNGTIKDHLALTGYEVGTIHKSDKFGEFEIIEYNNSLDVKIRFFNTGYEYTVYAAQIKDGRIRDPYAPTVYGVGITGNKYPTSENRKHLKEYQLWNGLLERCYCPKSQEKFPTYKGCSVSENFKSYEYFYEWCQEQKGFGNDGWELDKDLLVKGNKVYSEDTCVFLPKEVNTALTHRKNVDNKLPVGVKTVTNSKSYQASIKIDGKKYYLGVYSTPERAFQAYKERKETSLMKLALKWGEHLDPRAEKALYNYRVEIDD